MNALAQVLIGCIANGAVVQSICGAVTIPLLAWIAIRMLMPAIRGMNGDWRAQAASAACAACIPGALFLHLVAYGLATSAPSPCLQTVSGKILFGSLAGMMLAAVARAVLQAIRRDRDAAAVVAMALPAPARLAEIAARVNVKAQLLADDERSVVMLYGKSKPAVYVSTKALRDLSDDQLFAALHHERAHQDRSDHRIAPLLYFLTDLLPLPVNEAVTIYRRSREFCADACALGHVAAPDLAAALLQMIAPQGPTPAHAAAFAESAVLHERLRALLLSDQRKPNRCLRLLVAAALSAIVVAGVAVPHLAALAVYCSQMGVSS